VKRGIAICRRGRPSARPCTMVPSMYHDGAWLSSEDWGDDPEADSTAPGLDPSHAVTAGGRAAASSFRQKRLKTDLADLPEPWSGAMTTATDHQRPLRVPHDGPERRGPCHSSEGDAGDPYDAGRSRHLDDGASGRSPQAAAAASGRDAPDRSPRREGRPGRVADVTDEDDGQATGVRRATIVACRKMEDEAAERSDAAV
jgi:hypothetical protein